LFEEVAISDGMYRSGAKTILKVWSSDAAIVWSAATMDAAVKTATSLIETTKAPMYLRQTLRMRDAEVFGTMSET
jgi:hypothetical protein